MTEATGDLWHHERLARGGGYLRIAGLDEVGRGPLAGPVVAACIILPEGFDIQGINDSKKLTARQRERADERIRRDAVAFGISFVSPAVIDQINILRATHQAIQEAFLMLEEPPDYALIDGLSIPNFPCPAQKSLIGGDGLSASIAAASIVAKVARDRLMCEYDTKFPEYGFAGHKGYGSSKHIEALRENGPCPIHRLSFAPCRSG